jgi:aspartyl protease family protein
MIFWLTLILAILGGIALFLLGTAPIAEIPPELILAGGAVALFIVVYIATGIGSAHIDFGKRKLTLSAGFGAALLGALAYFFNNHESLKSFLVASAHESQEIGIEAGNGPKAVRIRRNPEGRYVARGNLNQSAADFLVDTGAAVVLLRQTDAEKAGIDISALTFSVPVETANGTAYAAPVRVRTLSVGPIRIDGLEALVAAPGSLNESLLGISFLRRLRSYELSGDFMTLRE